MANGEIVLLDDQRVLYRATVRRRPVTSLAVAPSGDELFAGDDEGYIVCCSLENTSWSCVASFPFREGIVQRLIAGDWWLAILMRNERGIHWPKTDRVLVELQDR